MPTLVMQPLYPTLQFRIISSFNLADLLGQALAISQTPPIATIALFGVATHPQKTTPQAMD